MGIQKLVIGNWKMNGSLALVEEIIAAKNRFTTNNGGGEGAEMIICPPLPYLLAFEGARGIQTGAQHIDLPHPLSGGQTGDVTASMAAECGAHYVLVGHSEHRIRYSETDAHAREKVAACAAAGLVPVLCVGEDADIRAKGEAAADSYVRSQIQAGFSAGVKDMIVAYEPVWAIGTGISATPLDISIMCQGLVKFIRGPLAYTGNLRMVYGGSVTPTNALEFFNLPELDGVLVGGASLRVKDFMAIYATACMI